MNSKAKGKRGELELAEWFRERGIAARRGQQFKGGSDSPDIVLDLMGIHVECKRTERLDLYGALEQATADAPKATVPVVFHRRSRERWVCILDAEQFVKLAKDCEDLAVSLAGALGRLPS